MPEAADVLLAILLGAAILYATTAGADFGGGVWDLLASGARKKRQRILIEKAITPVWEVNHVWMILMVVILFSGFPAAYSAISTALHIPLTLMLLGIVARGAAFTFRAYDRKTDDVQRRWGVIFSVASVITPLILGIIVGSIASGEIELEGSIVTSGFFTPWASSPFVWSVGGLTLTLFAYIAAVYLANEAEEDDLAEDFRLRSLLSGGLATALALLTYWLAKDGAPAIHQRIADNAALLFSAAALSSVAAIVTLQRRYSLARLLAIAQVILIVGGWGAAQCQYLLTDALSMSATSSLPMQTLIAWTLGLGIVTGRMYLLLDASLRAEQLS